MTQTIYPILELSMIFLNINFRILQFYLLRFCPNQTGLIATNTSKGLINPQKLIMQKNPLNKYNQLKIKYI